MNLHSSTVKLERVDGAKEMKYFTSAAALSGYIRGLEDATFTNGKQPILNWVVTTGETRDIEVIG